MSAKAEMSAMALVEILDQMDRAGIEVWLDGGWGVDALLTEQTRPHKDLDLILRVSDVPRVVRLLATRGFALKEGLLPHSFVLADGPGLEVDIHAVTFDPDGNGLYRMQNGEIWTYPREGFQGKGEILGRPVHCLSCSAQVLCHAHGYRPTEKDLEDMRRLEQRFGVLLPPQLKR